MKKLLAIFILGNLFLALGGWSPARADVPRIINYQGKLTDAFGAPVNIQAELTFAVYTEASGGGAIWSEAQTVTVTEGIFNVLLGAVNPLDPEYFSAGGPTYLGIKVGADSEMTPRQEIASGAYSLRADSSQHAEVAETLSASGRTAILEIAYPVGCIFTSTTASDPAELFGFGVWEAFGEGRVMVGKSGSGTFAAAGATGGAETVTLTADQSGLPSHNHSQNAHTHGFSSNASATYGVAFMTTGGSSLTSGGGPFIKEGYASINNATATNIASSAANASSAHTNLQPYIVVYMWQRTE